MRNKVWSIIGISVLGGAFLSFMYVNPFGGSITLSDTILQLSGSRGEFPLGTSATELMAFVMRMFPNYIFIMIFGTHLYNHFCTASVYVFTRQANRLVWYRKEVFQLLPYTFGFQVAGVLGHVVAVGFIDDGKAEHREALQKIPEGQLFSGEFSLVAGDAQQIHIAEIPAHIVKFQMAVHLPVASGGLHHPGLGAQEHVIAADFKCDHIHIVEAVGNMDVGINDFTHSWAAPFSQGFRATTNQVVP